MPPDLAGLCGSSAVSQRAWCLRWIATHSRVTHAGGEPEPKAEKVADDRVQRRRPLRLVAMQGKCRRRSRS